MANETFFVDTVGGNDPNSGTQASPFKTLQKGIDTWVGGGGNTVFIAGTDSLSATVTQTKAGDTIDGLNKIIGTNSSFVNDGTKAVLDGQSGIVNVLSHTGILEWFENLEIKNGTGDGITTGGTSGRDVYINVESNSHGGSGWDMLNRIDESILLQCRANNNTLDGFERLEQCFLMACEAIGNSSNGFDTMTDCCLVGYVTHNNTGSGINPASNSMLIAIHGVCDGNDIGINATTVNLANILFNRITNNTTDGLKIAASKVMLEDRNFFLGNGTKFNNSGILESLGNSLDTGTEGYENKAGDDFDLVASATLRESSIGVGSI